MKREIASWWQGPARERRFIYLREIHAFQVALVTPNLDEWKRDYNSEGIARDQIAKVIERTGGE